MANKPILCALSAVLAFSGILSIIPNDGWTPLPEDIRTHDSPAPYYVRERKDSAVRPRKPSTGFGAVLRRPLHGGELTILGWLTLSPTRGFGRQGLHQCGSCKCVYTEDKGLLNTSDAVMISLRAAVSEGMEALPTSRNEYQKWVAVENECPAKTWLFEKKDNVQALSQQGLFNVTALPVGGADVQWWNRQREWVLNVTLYSQLQNGNFIGNKTKMAAWFLSHCITPSQREVYINELQRYTTVDIYGKCGPLKCGPKNIWEMKEWEQKLKRKCDVDLLNGQYKFYIAFENSFCEEYVTEKVIRLYEDNIDIIPVVSGYVNYSRLLPPGSYIDVRDFKSVKQLADYLKHLDSHPAEYNEYIRRKRSAVPVEKKGSFCELCEFLHRTRNTTTVVDNVVDFYGIQQRCKTPRAFYRGHTANPWIFRDSFITAH